MPTLLDLPQEIRLWPGDAPGALGDAPHDIPTMTPFLPAPGSGSGAALVVLPGGGYGSLSPSEGEAYGVWLAAQGIAAFVVNYRLGSAGYRHPVMWQDASRAIRTVRAHAAQWGLDPARIGVVGSSAGGHLAATLLTHFDGGEPGSDDPVERVSSRPDLGILCYGVISMGEMTHFGSRGNLLGETPDPALIELLSNEKQVTSDTPPCFLWHTWEDAAVKVENTLAFAQALRAHGVKFDLHIYENGGHGLGLGTHAFDPRERHPWTRDCLYWLRGRGFLPC